MKSAYFVSDSFPSVLNMHCKQYYLLIMGVGGPTTVVLENLFLRRRMEVEQRAHDMIG